MHRGSKLPGCTIHAFPTSQHFIALSNLRSRVSTLVFTLDRTSATRWFYQFGACIAASRCHLHHCSAPLPLCSATFPSPGVSGCDVAGFLAAHRPSLHMCVLERHAAGGDEKGRTLLSCLVAANFQLRGVRAIKLQQELRCLAIKGL